MTWWAGTGGRRYTIGVEEEVMLLDPFDGSLAQCSDRVLPRLSVALGEHTSPETHAAVIELATGVHADAPSAVAELSALRGTLERELRTLGVDVAGAGMHPGGSGQETEVSGGDRYRALAGSLRFLARRQPTLALHVHVGVPDADDAIRLLNRLREDVPVLLALSANSPFSGGRDSGFASARTAIFGAFPRTGIPRAFACYAEYVEVVDALIDSGALPDPTFLWWDVRLQPALGTVEVRVMDAQSRVADSAALIALIQSLARLTLEGRPSAGPMAHEVLAENRFLAARDGLDARLIDPGRRTLVPVRALVDDLVRACRPHAAALGCADLLHGVGRLAAVNGASRQRRWISEGGDVPSLVSTLADQFKAQHRPERSGPCVAGLPTAVLPSN